MFLVVQIERRRIQHLAGGVDDGRLAAGAKARVEAQHRLAGQRRLGQQGAQVAREDLNGVALGRVGQGAAGVARHSRQQQPLGRVVHRQLQLLGQR